MKAGQKGFLGPIGDDLPSLIPLLFALMLFFYVFTFTWSTFDQRGQAFDDALAALRVGNTLKGNNYLKGIDTFTGRCIEAQATKRLNFMAGLVPLSTGPGQTFAGIDIENIEQHFFESGGEKFMCSSLKTGQEKPEPGKASIIIRSFPIALEFQNKDTGMFYVRPMLLVVITWR